MRTVRPILRRLKSLFVRARERQPERLKNRRGVAMVLAITSISLLTYLAMEVMYDATVEYTVNAQSLNRLKAYYAAKSGLEISLLRLKIYQTVMSKMNGKMGSMGNYVDMIWQFPFAWPLPVPPEADSVTKADVKKMVKESSMDASFTTSIQDEGSKIDLNDLISPSKTLKEITKKRLLEIFRIKTETDDNWRTKYGAFRFEELINNIADWMSDKNTSLNGGDKRGGYAEFNKETQSFPPNRGFRTIQELRMVYGMTDDFFDLLSPQITIYGMRGVNPNVASREILKSLDAGMTDQVVSDIISRRDDQNKGGPFKEAKEFWDFAEEKGARFQDKDVRKIPLSFDTLVSFRIKATGEYGNAVREIEVVVTDLDQTAAKIKKFVKTDTTDATKSETEGPDKTPPVGSSGGDQTNGTKTIPKGPPRIVYWTER